MTAVERPSPLRSPVTLVITSGRLRNSQRCDRCSSLFSRAAFSRGICGACEEDAIENYFFQIEPNRPVRLWFTYSWLSNKIYLSVMNSTIRLENSLIYVRWKRNRVRGSGSLWKQRIEIF